MILSKETQSLQVFLAGAKITNDCDFSAFFIDVKRDATWAPQLVKGHSNGVTPVTVVPAPDQITSRDIQRFFFYNNDTANVTVTVKYVDTGGDTLIKKATLTPGQTLSFGINFGWQVN